MLRCRVGAMMLLAWVLWVQHEQLSDSAVGQGYRRTWAPETGYPDDGYSDCVRDARTLANRQAEGERGANVESIEVKELIGNRFSVSIKLKKGGSIWQRYVCFPHTVKPEGAE